MALTLIKEDGTGKADANSYASAADGDEGLSEQQSADLTRTVYSKRDTRPIISHLTQAMLGKYGILLSGGSGAVRLVRA